MDQSATEQEPAVARTASENNPTPPASSDAFFILALVVIAVFYVGLILAMLLADIAYLRPPQSSGFANTLTSIARSTFAPLATPPIRYSLKLSLISCTITAILSIWVA